MFSANIGLRKVAGQVLPDEVRNKDAELQKTENR